MANFYDFTKPGKNSLNESKKYGRQADEYLKEYDKTQKEEAANKAAKEENSALSSARFAYGATYARSKNRKAAVQESITYEHRAATTGMTEMVSEAIEKALLLDEEEFAALNPEYKTEIRERVRGFLENANINENISNKDTLALMEYVYKSIPDAKTGKYLTEDDISRLLQLQKPVEIENSIRDLSGDVSSRVAELVESEQKRIKETNEKLKKAGVKEEAANIDELPVEDIEPAEAPKGSEGFVRETPRTGLLESLAVNEAVNMINEGKEYNSDLCLANALMYITITEAMDTLGLMNVDTNVYANIISAAGGTVVNEASSSAKKAFKNGGTDYTKYEAGRMEAQRIAAERKGKPANIDADAVSKKMQAMSKGGVKDGSENLQESYYTQWKAPLATSTYDDFAERIRQRKLQKLAENEGTKTETGETTLLG